MYGLPHSQSFLKIMVLLEDGQNRNFININSKMQLYMQLYIH